MSDDDFDYLEYHLRPGKKFDDEAKSYISKIVFSANKIYDFSDIFSILAWKSLKQSEDYFFLVGNYRASFSKKCKIAITFNCETSLLHFEEWMEKYYSKFGTYRRPTIDNGGTFHLLSYNQKTIDPITFDVDDTETQEFRIANWFLEKGVGKLYFENSQKPGFLYFTDERDAVLYKLEHG